ncbi:hypothetical protein ACFC06_26080 [Nocardia sp. NPDC056064]|uniref:hypothetical protein n=1 Tax=Nocardia sp. NPDC056064 TaxID=3345701 RepID=UPI0035D59132
MSGRNLSGQPVDGAEPIGSSRFDGWPVFTTITALLGVMTLVVLTVAGWDTDGYRLLIRSTARTSLVLFLSAFLALALHTLRPAEPTRWLVRNRRYLGLSFAMSHGIHLAAIIALATTDSPTFWTLASALSIIVGGLGYLAIVFLVATSFDRVTSWFRTDRWHSVVGAGTWLIWFLFVYINASRIPGNPWYAIPVAILVGALVVRIAARRSSGDGPSVAV